jgi:hypothetical protein
MPTHLTVSLTQLPLEIILYIGTFVDHTSLRSLRATSDGMCKLLTPTAFGTFLVRLGSMGLCKRLAHIEHPEPSLSNQGTYKPSLEMLSHIRVCRIELGNASAYQGQSCFVPMCYHQLTPVFACQIRPVWCIIYAYFSQPSI